MRAQEAVDLYHKGQVQEAANKFAEAEKLDPNIATIQLNLAFSNLALSQTFVPGSPQAKDASGKAIDAFQKFLKLKPADERARSYLVQTFVDTGRYDDAVAFFKPEVEKTPPNGEALATLGTIANKTGRFQDAKTWYEKRIAAEPANPDARLAVGVLMWDYLHNHIELQGDDRLKMADDAIAQLAEAIKIAPNAPNAYTYTNLVYRERAKGHRPQPLTPPPGTPGAPPAPPAGTPGAPPAAPPCTTKECVDAENKIIDLERQDIEKANEFFKKAVELQKGVKKQ